MSWVERRNNAYDDLTLQLIHRVLSPASSTVDAGANRGLILRELIRSAPQGRHYAFEPIPQLAAQLQRFKRAKVHQVALADYVGESTFHYLPDSDAESSLYRRLDRESGRRVIEITVPVRRLDDVIPTNERIDFIKVDVEGAQAALLRGAREVLRRCKPVVVLECHVNELPEAADLLEEASLDVWLLEDYLAGVRRSRREVERRAVHQGEWYFVAAAAPLTSAR